jgi:hypothetical protein
MPLQYTIPIGQLKVYYNYSKNFCALILLFTDTCNSIAFNFIVNYLSSACDNLVKIDSTQYEDC